MSSTRAILLTALSVVLVPGCEHQFREIYSAEGRFKVQMPGKPVERTKLWILQEGGNAYAVSYCDLPMDATELQLDAVVDRVCGKSGRKLIRSTETTLQQKYPGREVTAEVPGGTMLRARIFIAGRRLYQVVVDGSKAWVNSVDREKFLDSFVITP
jgi:hypothetical protein